MGLINTTDIIDSAMFLKAKLKKNMVGDNYFIESLQEKRNKDWYLRSNIVDIEEELNKQVDYTSESPVYSPIEVAITNVKAETGEDLGTDWANIAFKDLKHPGDIGYRYRFSFDFEKDQTMTEEEKYYNTCIWLAINKAPLTTGNSVLIRRCNASLVFLGSPTNDYENITEHHYEPVILENDLKYISFYYNQVLSLPQAEWYATMQMNYFSNCIKINDRFLFGGFDLNDRENNSAYKVKAVIKSTSSRTFTPNGEDQINTIPLVLIAMDKDVIDEADDFVTRTADMAPMYIVKESVPEGKYEIICEDFTERILLGETIPYEMKLYYGSQLEQANFTYEYNLVDVEGNIVENQEDYYEFSVLSDNSFQITNKNSYFYGKLEVVAKCETADGQNITQQFNITLGGFY